MEKENNAQSYRTHRVGSVTTGISMVGFGVLLLLHSLFGMISYSIIFSLWPLILIGLGVELLLSNIWAKKIVYDKAAIFLLIIMTLFVMGMAVADICMQTTEVYMLNGR